MNEKEQMTGDEEQAARKLGQRIEKALEPRGVRTDVVSVTHHEAEKSRVYDEGFLEAAVIVARGGDPLAEAYRRLCNGVGKDSALAPEIVKAHNSRLQTQAAPAPDYGTQEKPFGSLQPDAPWAGSDDKTELLRAHAGDAVSTGEKRFVDNAMKQIKFERTPLHPLWSIDELADWFPDSSQEVGRLKGVRLGDVHRRLEAERQLSRSEAEVARLRAIIDVLQRTIRDLAT